MAKHCRLIFRAQNNFDSTTNERRPVTFLNYRVSHVVKMDTNRHVRCRRNDCFIRFPVSDVITIRIYRERWFLLRTIVFAAPLVPARFALFMSGWRDRGFSPKPISQYISITRAPYRVLFLSQIYRVRLFRAFLRIRPTPLTDILPKQFETSVHIYIYVRRLYDKCTCAWNKNTLEFNFVFIYNFLLTLYALSNDIF